jgi:hypothetical protein
VGGKGFRTSVLLARVQGRLSFNQFEAAGSFSRFTSRAECSRFALRVSVRLALSQGGTIAAFNQTTNHR